MIEEEDTKRFDSVHGGMDEDNQPDPDEPLMMDAGNGRVWLVKVGTRLKDCTLPLRLAKIPRHLMERWCAIDEEGLHLATIRVYQDAASSTGRKPRIMLAIPPSPENGGVAEEYEMDMVNDNVENQIVVAEREKDPGTTSRARTTILTGRVKHECNLRPRFTDGYRRRLKERVRAANEPARQIRMIEDVMAGGRGDINRLTSGAATHAPFNIVVRAPSAVSCELTGATRAARGHRRRSRSRRRASSSATRASRATSSSTRSSARSRSASGGRTRLCASVRSSPTSGSRPSSPRLRSSTGAESTTARGSSCRISRATG